MRLRDNFPKTKEQAKTFNVELDHANCIFKIFDINDSSSLTSIDNTMKNVNQFLADNGYEPISVIDFIKNDFNYESEDEIVSLSRHGYLEKFVLFISNENDTKVSEFLNIDNDIKNLLKEFFTELGFKLKNKPDLKIVAKAHQAIDKLPEIPSENVFVNFEYENQIFYISISDYKIELVCYLQDYYEDEEGNKSDFEQIQQYCFKYELEGYTVKVGGFDEFSFELLHALKNVEVKGINFSEEE